MTLILIIILLSAAVTGFYSFYLFSRDSKGYLLLLIGSGFLLRLAFILFDPILNIWDESFHAVVAKNFTKHWLIPTLYDDTLIRLPTGWVECHYWLHKQPLFLWQMAISIKLLGSTILAARLPGAILASIQIGLLFSIATKITNRKVAYYTALIYTIAYYPLALVSGAACNDQNDISFVFYITASIWAYLNYLETKSWKWALFVGILAGMAVMVKWLAGLLVFLGWSFSLVFMKEFRLHWRRYLHLLLAIIACVMIFLPWQIYILKTYPVLASEEFQLISKHFTEVVELHEGPWYFYLEGVQILYPFYKHLGAIIILISLLVLFPRIKNKHHKILVFSSVVFVYVFFSIAATKMTTFVFIVSPFIYLSLGYLITQLADRINVLKRPLLFFSIMLFLIFKGINIRQTLADHYSSLKLSQIEQTQQSISILQDRYKGKDAVIFGVGYLNATQVLYFTDLVVYTVVPNTEQIELLLQNHKSPVIIDNGNLPDYILNDKRIEIIKDVKFPQY